MILPEFLLSASPVALAVMFIGLFIASLARGYSGFGFSAVLVSSWSLVGVPARAIGVALLLEVIASCVQAFSVWRDIPWRRVVFLLMGAAIGTGPGVLFPSHDTLSYTDLFKVQYKASNRGSARRGE